MLSKLMQWFRGSSGSSTPSESAPAATAPEPSSMPSEPPADMGAEDTSEPAGDEPA